MARTFQIPIKDQPEVLVSRAQQLAVSSSVHFVADKAQGRFTGRGIEGTYRFADGMLIVTVTKKPPFVTWGMVEHMLHRFFA
ncbi:MAG: hypothetical protein N3A55_08835 [Methylohalobius sp.]|nr:hypothetical protein [Methylohalobius sp.]